MDEQRTLSWLRWLLLTVAVGLVGLTTWGAVFNPQSGTTATVAQWLAVCGAVATLVAAVVVIKGDARQQDVNPAPAVAILSGMTGFLTVASVSLSGTLLLVSVVSGAAGLLGGVLLAVASR